MQIRRQPCAGGQNGGGERDAGVCVRGDPGRRPGVDDLGNRRLDRSHAGHRIRPGCEDPDSFRSDNEHPGAADERFGGVAVEHIRGSDEIGDESVDGILVDLAGGADLLDAPVVEYREPVAQGQRLVLIVGDDDECDADFALDRLEFDLHLLAQFEVQRAEWLVEQQHPGRPISARARATR